MNPILRSVLIPLVRLAASLAVITAIWVGALWFFDVSPIIGKTPADVYDYLFTVPESAAHREAVFADFWITMLDTFIGFGVGMFVAALTAMAFQISKGFEAAVMPLAMICRSVPLVAMAPIIVLIFGRDFASVAAMGTIVVIFPALVTIVEGLRSASPAMTEVVQVYGGHRGTVLHKVGMPASLPSFFTAARVSIPGALTGAMLAEWLATGDGMGYGIIQAVTQTDYDRLWASVLIVTLASLVVYSLIGVVERLVARSTGIGLAA